MSIHDAITLLMKSNYKLPSAAPLFLPNAKLFLHVIMKTLKVRLDNKKERKTIAAECKTTDFQNPSFKCEHGLTVL